MNEEVVNKLTNDGWLCPWCFSCPFPRPANHPVAKNDVTRIVASTTTQICEAVRINITTDDSWLKEELNYMYKAVSIDQHAMSEEISESHKSMKTMLEESKSLLKDAAILKSSPGPSTSNPGKYQHTIGTDLRLVQSSTDKHYTCIKLMSLIKKLMMQLGTSLLKKKQTFLQFQTAERSFTLMTMHTNTVSHIIKPPPSLGSTRSYELPQKKDA